MVFVRSIFFLIIVVMAQYAFCQDCPSGECNRPMTAMLETVVQAPVKVVGSVVRSSSVRRVVAAKPVRRVLGIFRRKCR